MKIIEQIKNIIKENFLFLLTLVFVYFLFNVDFSYIIYRPGGLIDMKNRIKTTEKYEEKGSINMTYVNGVKGSVPFLVLSKVMPNWDLVKKDNVSYDGKTLEQTEEIDKILMQEAISNATVSAFREANIKYKINSTKFIVTQTHELVKELTYGDELLSINGIDINNTDDIKKSLQNKNIGDKVTIKLKRKGKLKTVTPRLIGINNVPKIGIGYAIIYDFDSKYNIKVKTKSSESGPSGGLMTSLEIYNMITKKDLTRGRIIAGTGTIEEDGTVGVIGGVKYKLLGAEKKHAEIFICPKENYKEALKVKNKNKLKIKVYAVENLKEAINLLESGL